MTLSFLCRAKTLLAFPTPISSRGVASLSGIHNGIRRSQRTDTRIPRRTRDDTLSGKDDTPRLSYKERQQARAEAKESRGWKLLRGKKDVRARPSDVKPLSRRARFFDPESSFGKKSLVYQVKTGQVPEALKDGDIFSQKIQPHRQLEEKAQANSWSEPRWQPRSQPRSEFKSEPKSESGSEPRPRSGSRLGSEPRPRPRSEFRSEPRSQPRSKPRAESGSEPRSQRPRSPYRRQFIAYSTASSQFLYGRTSVEAALRSGRRKVYKLYLYIPERKQPNDVDIQQIRRLAAARDVPVIEVDMGGREELEKLCACTRGRPHNNCFLEASPLPVLPVNHLGALSEDPTNKGFTVSVGHQSAEEKEITGDVSFVKAPRGPHKPLIVLLDGVEDPQNLGAIIRSASFLGATAVAFTARGSAPISAVAGKAAAGAAEYMTLFSVDKVDTFLDRSREAGWEVYAAHPAAAEKESRRRQMDIDQLAEADPLTEKPCILVLGSEGHGLSRTVLRYTDVEVYVPNRLDSEVLDSLNVSVAGGMLCHAFLRERRSKGEEVSGKADVALF
ncbi:mitochondrial rRNA methyltransferase 1 [Echria macrotheca]|uniref:rRNA methyltransferase 1, mitochondrial n=1 Tax=Echria macrotheca TaxID=438768 RepID=A0AAJ0BFD2_9PEZI|nr:mitochondrial rRNA methyltransferase 1 [Echria macrotheca]